MTENGHKFTEYLKTYDEYPAFCGTASLILGLYIQQRFNANVSLHSANIKSLIVDDIQQIVVVKLFTGTHDQKESEEDFVLDPTCIQFNQFYCLKQNCASRGSHSCEPETKEIIRICDINLAYADEIAFQRLEDTTKWNVYSYSSTEKHCFNIEDWKYMYRENLEEYFKFVDTQKHLLI